MAELMAEPWSPLLGTLCPTSRRAASWIPHGDLDQKWPERFFEAAPRPLLAKCFRPPRFETNASVSAGTPWQVEGSASPAKHRDALRSSPRFDRGTRACAPDQSGCCVASPATEVRGTSIKRQRSNPPELRAARRQREGLGQGTRRSARWNPLIKVARSYRRFLVMA